MQLCLAKTGFTRKPICAELYLLSIYLSTHKGEDSTTKTDINIKATRRTTNGSRWLTMD